MRATETKLSEFLSKPGVQYSIPIYQRTYSWKNEQCKQLWEDIIHAGCNKNIADHFIGPIVYIKESTFQVSTLTELLVIDGQQRLTTTMLILEALARKLHDSEMEGFSADMIRNLYLSNQYQKGEGRYKLLLSKTDKESLKAVVEQKENDNSQSLHIDQNFAWFSEKMKDLDSDGLAALCKGLNKLTIVDIALDREDKPQRIFESMNSTGLGLSQADLIRNFVLMDLGTEQQNQLYEDHWRQMEMDFGQDDYERYFDEFMRDYLILKTKKIPNKDKVYKEFKEYAKDKCVPTLVADVHKFAKYYCYMALDKEQNKILKKAFNDLRELELNVAYPLLLQLYHNYSNGSLSATDFEETVRMIESYAFRRAVCHLPPNSHNKIILATLNTYAKDGSLAAVKEYLLGLRESQRFPGDEEFRRNFPDFRPRNHKYWLYRLENNDRKERITDSEYTTEHIMPQKLTKEWESSLGAEHKTIHDTHLNSPGNITLTGYNPKYGNRSFAYKRDTEGGFKQSPLKLNKDLGIAKEWNKEAIHKRALRLANMVIKVWPFP